MIKALLIAIFLTSVHGASAAAKPLKVFILACQSNMQGKGHVSTFDYIGMDPKTAPMLKEMPRIGRALPTSPTTTSGRRKSMD